LTDILLAREAEDIFWLARYVERAENLTRILDVNATFSRDSRGAQDWLPVLRLNADEERFFKRHPTASPEAVLRFYVIDRDNPTSIVSTITSARSNARTLRSLISREIWSQLNVFQKSIAALNDLALAPGQLTRLLTHLKEGCQTHTGITDGTLYRDQCWSFYWLGRYLERADQTTRLLDIKYHLLLPRVADVGSTIDIGQWNTLLRSAAGYHAYRRIQSGIISPAGIAGFLLLNPDFPRSVLLCVAEADRLIRALRADYGLAAGAEAADALAALRATLTSLTIAEVISHGLHEFCDVVQLRLIAINASLAAAFFREVAAAGQAQTQSG